MAVEESNPLLRFLKEVIKNTPSLQGMQAEILLQEFGMDDLDIGVVVDVIPYIGCYIVQTTLVPRLQCISLQDSIGQLGARSFTTITVGTQVLFYEPEKMPVGIIVGVLPSNTSYVEPTLPDFLHMAPRAGILEDTGYNWPVMSLDKSGGILHFGAGRPIDSLPGHWGYINHLGLGLGLGHISAWMKASDMAKLEMFYLDHYVRLTAYNYELATAGSEERYLEDEGEWNRTHFSTPFPWEALGNTAPVEDVLVDGKAVVGEGQEYAYTEPTKDDQIGMWRYMYLEGYLGDISREYVALPPTSGPEYLSRPWKERDYRGVLEIRKSLDGAYSVRSAKGVSLEKTFLIPVPIQLKKAEDPEGDSADNYNGSLWPWSSGDTAPERNEFDPLTTNPMVKCMLSDEETAYANNWHYQESIKRHPLDWKLPTEEEVQEEFWSVSGQTPFGLLGDDFTYSTPATQEDVQVDHRSTATYYEGKAGIYLTDDGSIIMQDAYGSQMIMSGGNIWTTCPGDKFSLPGRSDVTMAGEDVILRARKHADLTTTLGDIRIKAEENLHVLGGNSDGDTPGTGGVIIESRSTGEGTVGVGTDGKSGGIVLKSAGQLVSWGKSVYINSSGGDVVLDANKGDNNVVSIGRQHIRRIGNKAVDEFMSATTSNIVVNTYTRYLTNFGGSIRAPGSLRLYGNSYLHVNGQLIADQVVSLNSVRARTPDIITFSQWTMEPYTSDENLYDAGRQVAIDYGNTFVAAYYTSETGAGNSTRMLQTGVSLRTSVQYGLGTDFVIPQSKWQRNYESSATQIKWTETDVKAPFGGSATLPYPGKAKWRDEATFKKVTKRFYNDLEVRAETVDYETVGNEAAAIGEVTPEEGYYVSRD